MQDEGSLDSSSLKAFPKQVTSCITEVLVRVRAVANLE